MNTETQDCAIYDRFGNMPPCIDTIRLTKSWKADTIASPIEDGSVVFDNKVILPTEATVEIIVAESITNDSYGKKNTPETALEILKSWFKNRSSEFFDVYSKFDILENMTVIGMTEINDPQKSDAIGITINLREVKTISASKGKVVKETIDAPVQDSGSVSGLQVDGLQVKVVK